MCLPSSRTSCVASSPRPTSDSSKLTTRYARPSSTDATIAPSAFSCLRSAVREVAQRAALQRLRLDEARRCPPCRRSAKSALGVRARPLRLLAHALELGAQLLRLARALVQPRERLAARHRLDPARARADRALGEDRERPDLGGRAHVRAAAELARVARAPRRRGRRRRTSRRRASSRRGCAPPRSASRTCARAGSRRSSRSRAARPRSRCSGVSACGCVKSKRSLSGRTAEPAWRTWSPSTSCSALCSRCVAVWFAIVGKRDRPRHDRAHAVAGGEAGALERAAPGRPRSGRPRAARAREPSSFSIAAGVGDLAAAGGIERRLAQLREEEAVAELLERADLRQHVGLLVADELAAEARARRELGRALRARRRRTPAREISRCSLHQRACTPPR